MSRTPAQVANAIRPTHHACSYPLNEASGNAIDAWAALDLTASGTPAYLSPLPFGAGVTFNGSNAFFRRAANPFAGVTGEVTFSAWFCGLPQDGKVIASIGFGAGYMAVLTGVSGFGHNTNGVLLYITNSNASAPLYGNNATDEIEGVLDGAPHHIIASKCFDGAGGYKVKIWIDGVLEQESATITHENVTADEITIGCYGNGEGRFFTGTIGQVDIYDCGLTDDEAEKLYRAGIGQDTDDFYFSDLFNRSNTDPSATPGSVGNNWVDRTGSVWEIESNKARVAVANTHRYGVLFRPLTEARDEYRGAVTFTNKASGFPTAWARFSDAGSIGLRMNNSSGVVNCQIVTGVGTANDVTFTGMTQLTGGSTVTITADHDYLFNWFVRGIDANTWYAYCEMSDVAAPTVIARGGAIVTRAELLAALPPALSASQWDLADTFDSVSHEWPDEPTTIFFVGSSTTEYSVYSAGNSPVNIAQDYLDSDTYLAVNSGHSGALLTGSFGNGQAYSVALLAAVTAEVAAGRTVWASICIGSNDAMSDVAAATYAGTAQALTDSLIAAGASKIVWHYIGWRGDASAPRLALIQAYNAKLHTITGVGVKVGDTSWYNTTLANYGTLYHSDQIHPNAAGVAAIGQRWATSLLRSRGGAALVPGFGFGFYD
jgi:lysophospholipase L1-like esterase